LFLPAVLFLELLLAATGPVVDQLGSLLLEFCLGIFRGNLNHEQSLCITAKGLGLFWGFSRSVTSTSQRWGGRSYDVLQSSVFALLVSQGNWKAPSFMGGGRASVAFQRIKDRNHLVIGSLNERASGWSQIEAMNYHNLSRHSS
jgi:hypothetical protein